MMEHFLDKTIEAWQPLSERELNEEDARQIIENVSAFFGLLEEWAEKEQNQNDKRKQNQVVEKGKK